jgi:[histone H3]-lysine4 N-trimethyltransferase ATXR3
LGRVTAVVTPAAATDQSSSTSTTAAITTQYTVKWIVGGSSSGLQREWLKATTAEKEGFIANDNGDGSISSGTIVIGGHLSRRAARAKPPPASPTIAMTMTTATNKKKAPEAAAKSKAAAKPVAASKRKSMDTVASSSGAAPTSSNTIESVSAGTSAGSGGMVKKGKKRKLIETTSATTTSATAAAVPSSAAALSPTLNQQPSLLLSSSNATATTAMNLYDKHRREFDRIVTRLEKLDKFGWFWDEAPENFVENYDKRKTPSTTTTITTTIAAKNKDGVESPDDASIDDGSKPALAKAEATTVPLASTTHDDPLLSSLFPSHAPYNWEMIRRRREHGRYVLDRVKEAEQEREKLLLPYFEWKKQQAQQQQQRQQQLAEQNALTTAKRGKRKRSPNKKGVAPTITAATTTEQKEPTGGVNKAVVEKEEQCTKQVKNYSRVFHPKGVHWDLFKSDVFAMLDAAIAREDKEEERGAGGRGSLPAAANKVREAVLQACERTGERHTREMQLADDRHFFVQILEQTRNTEAAMQSWRQSAFPERIYERLSGDVVSAGLEELDERIAKYELKTSLPDCFVGLSYRYDDTGQSEAWMQSVVEETEANTLHKNKRKKISSSSSNKNNTNNSIDKALAQKKRNEERRQVAVAMAAAGDGVRRAQIASTMNSLLIGVQDRVMTEWGVLKQPELRSANWLATVSATSAVNDDVNNNSNNSGSNLDLSTDSKMVDKSGDCRTDTSDDVSTSANDSKPVTEPEPMELVSSNDGVVIGQGQITHATPDLASESCDTQTKTMEESSAAGYGRDTVCTPGNERMETASSPICEAKVAATAPSNTDDVESAKVVGRGADVPVSREASPEILEHPVWGMDCYTVSLWQEQRFTCLR